ncbi:hypothetical protein LTR85_005545 [Meristemomyces frigidus]|nr:hypothetical protein LTR85_005545 [Meristemomyces frigidus]
MGGLHKAHVSNPSGRYRILDVGYGTGAWLYDMLDEYPNAQLVGIDMAPTEEENPRPGRDIRFVAHVDFTQNDWGLREGSFDLVRMSQLCGSVPDWQRLCTNAWRYLAPGTGRLELCEIDWEPCCDDGTLSSDPNAPMNLWWRTICDATERTGRPIAYPQGIASLLERIGFEIEVVDSVRLQTWEDMGIADDARPNHVARWFLTTMGRTTHDCQRLGELGDIRAYSGMSMALFTQVAGWSAEDVERLQEGMYQEITDRNIHFYQRL